MHVSLASCNYLTSNEDRGTVLHWAPQGSALCLSLENAFGRKSLDFVSSPLRSLFPALNCLHKFPLENVCVLFICLFSMLLFCCVHSGSLSLLQSTLSHPETAVWDKKN